MRNRALVFGFLLILFECLGAAKPAIDWQIGEETHYNVKYGFLHLGQLRIQVLDTTTINNRPVYHCRIYIDSNPDLPFIKLHDVYDSFIDAEEIYSHRFISYENKGDHTIYTRYDFDYPQRQIRIRIENLKDNGREVLLDSTAVIPRRVQDSLSLLFFARAMVKNKADTTISVFAYNNFEETEIRFTGDTREIEYDEKKIPAYYLDGKLKFVGIAGLKEGFKGWFSPDSQSIPIKAKMKAFIGNVSIQLKSYKNWIAPEAAAFNKP
ncbi:MAG: hypothetical protein Kow0037_08270 [Calditrichia bacterium]